MILIEEFGIFPNSREIIEKAGNNPDGSFPAFPTISPTHGQGLRFPADD